MVPKIFILNWFIDKQRNISISIVSPKGSMFWWNDQLAALCWECLAAFRKFILSKGDILLHETWKRAKAAWRRSIKRSRLQCWKEWIGEVEKDPWGVYGILWLMEYRQPCGRGSEGGAPNSDTAERAPPYRPWPGSDRLTKRPDEVLGWTLPRKELGYGTNFKPLIH